MMRFRDVIREYARKGRVKVDWYCRIFVRPVTKRTGYYETTTFVVTTEGVLNVADMQGIELDDAIANALAKLPEAMDEKIVAIVQEYIPVFHNNRTKTYIITPYAEADFDRARKKISLVRMAPETIRAILERAKAAGLL